MADPEMAQAYYDHIDKRWRCCTCDALLDGWGDCECPEPEFSEPAPPAVETTPDIASLGPLNDGSA